LTSPLLTLLPKQHCLPPQKTKKQKNTTTPLNFFYVRLNYY
jgi:hypothetical protein